MKKLLVLVLSCLLLTQIFAQERGVGLTLGETNSFVSIMDQKLQAVINPQLISAEVEIKLMPMLGINGFASYDYRLSELFVYGFGLNLYVPIFFIEPNASINYVVMTKPGIKTLTFNYDGIDYNYTYEFNYKFAAKVGLNFFLGKQLCISTDIGYYGEDIKSMLDSIVSKNIQEVSLNSYVFIGAKFWIMSKSK